MITVNGERYIGAWKECTHEFSVLSSNQYYHTLFDTKWGRNAKYIRSEEDEDGTTYDIYRVQKAYTIK